MWPPKFSDCIEACNVARRRCERLVTAGLAQPDVNKVTQVIVEVIEIHPAQLPQDFRTA